MTLRQAIDQSMTEKEWMALIVELAQRLGWEVWHHYDSRRTIWGVPDLELLRPPRHIRAETKREGKSLTAEQYDFLSMLIECGEEAYCWWPSDFDEVVRVLGKSGYQAARGCAPGAPRAEEVIRRGRE